MYMLKFCSGCARNLQWQEWTIVPAGNKTYTILIALCHNDQPFAITIHHQRMWAGFELMYRDSGNLMHLLIFHNTVFPTYPENHNTKEGFCFLNRGAKTKFFLAVRVKNNLSMMRTSFLLKQLCCCCLDIRFFSLILIGVSFCNSSQLFALFIVVQWYIENCFTITHCCFKSLY